jgi:hypothetical protein
LTISHPLSISTLSMLIDCALEEAGFRRSARAELARATFVHKGGVQQK